MAPKQEKAQLRRMSIPMGIGTALAFFLLLRAIGPLVVGDISAGTTSPDNTLLFFGDLAGWPRIFRGFWPLDLLMACLWGCLLTSLIAELVAEIPDSTDEDYHKPLSIRARTLLAFGFTLGLCAFLAMMASILSGWFGGIVTFPDGIPLVAAISVVIAVGVGIMKLMEVVLFKWPPRLSRAFWQVAKSWPVMRPFIRMGDWFSAKDVTETTE